MFPCQIVFSCKLGDFPKSRIPGRQMPGNPFRAGEIRRCVDRKMQARMAIFSIIRAACRDVNDAERIRGVVGIKRHMFAVTVF